jgi:hypothetical protein
MMVMMLGSVMCNAHSCTVVGSLSSKAISTILNDVVAAHASHNIAMWHYAYKCSSLLTCSCHLIEFILMFKPTCECSVQSDAAHAHVMQCREPMLLQAPPTNCHTGGTCTNPWRAPVHARSSASASGSTPSQTLAAAGRC